MGGPRRQKIYFLKVFQIAPKVHPNDCLSQLSNTKVIFASQRRSGALHWSPPAMLPVPSSWVQGCLPGVWPMGGPRRQKNNFLKVFQIVPKVHPNGFLSQWSNTEVDLPFVGFQFDTSSLQGHILTPRRSGHPLGTRGRRHPLGTGGGTRTRIAPRGRVSG